MQKSQKALPQKTTKWYCKPRSPINNSRMTVHIAQYIYTAEAEAAGMRSGAALMAHIITGNNSSGKLVCCISRTTCSMHIVYFMTCAATIDTQQVKIYKL